MCVPKKSTAMLTDDVPQSNDIVIARGRQAERGRLLAASAVMVRKEWFDNVLPGKVEWWYQSPYVS